MMLQGHPECRDHMPPHIIPQHHQESSALQVLPLAFWSKALQVHWPSHLNGHMTMPFWQTAVQCPFGPAHRVFVPSMPVHGHVSCHCL